MIEKNWDDAGVKNEGSPHRYEQKTRKKERKRPLKRLKTGQKWVLFGVVVALLALWLAWQQESIVTDTYTVSAEGVPERFDELRIVHLSDLHGKEFGTDSVRLLEEVAKLEPDLIAVTGDLIDRAEQLEMLPALAQGLAALAPTYYVTGNHEWAVRQVNGLKELLRENGITVLSNEYVTLERGEDTLVVAGIDDPNGPADQKTGAELRAEITAALGEEVYTILLAHRDSLFEYAGWGYDLVLCGHGHGGIIRIPILDRGLLSTGRTLFPEVDGGLYGIGDGGSCVVSRGLGSNTVPVHAFRLFNRPHLPLVVLSARPESSR